MTVMQPAILDSNALLIQMLRVSDSKNTVSIKNQMTVRDISYVSMEIPDYTTAVMEIISIVT
jgi:hypothetical protein